MEEDKIHLAVYGTLRLNQCNWFNYLQGCTYITTSEIPNFEMYHNGRFPYIIEVNDKNAKIIADIFEIDKKTLKTCDLLEEYPNHYNRKIIEVESIFPWIYYLPDIKRARGKIKKVPSGNWLSIETRKAYKKSRGMMIWHRLRKVINLFRAK